MAPTPQYRSVDEKVQDIERYLVRQVDMIRRLVIVAVGLGAIAAVASLWLAFGNDGSSPRHPESSPVANAPAVPDGRDAAEPGATTPPASDATSASEPGDQGLVARARETAGRRSDSPPTTAPELPPDPGKRLEPDAARSGTSASEPATRPADDATRRPVTEPATPPASEPAGRSTGDAAVEPTGDERGTSAGPPKRVADLPAWSFRVGDMALAGNIVDMEPRAVADRFPARYPQIFCWTRIETDDLGAIPEERRYVYHRWYQNGRLERERKITIGSTSYRVWSGLPEPGRYPGNWRVDVVDSEGRVLESRRLFIEPEL